MGKCKPPWTSSGKWMAAIAAGLGICSIAFGVFSFYQHRPQIDQEAWSLESSSRYGDFIGGHLGATASFAGTLFLVAALLLQRDELAAQREDLRISQTIFSRQESALREQISVSERSAIFGQIFQIDEKRSIEVRGLAAAVHTIEDGVPYFSNIENFQRYVVVYQRVEALEGLLESLLEKKCLSKEDAADLRHYCASDGGVAFPHPKLARPLRGSAHGASASKLERVIEEYKAQIADT